MSELIHHPQVKNVNRWFQNRVLIKIFRYQTGDVDGGSRILHIGELHKLYSLPILGWPNHGRRLEIYCARRIDERHIKFMSENLQRINHLEEIGTDLRIIKYILRAQSFTLLLQRTRNVRTYKTIKMTGSCHTHISLHPHFIFALHRKWMHKPLVTRCEIMLYLNEYKTYSLINHRILAFAHDKQTQHSSSATNH